MLKSVIFTGSTRFGPQTNSVNGATGGTISIMPWAISTVLAITTALFG